MKMLASIALATFVASSPTSYWQFQGTRPDCVEQATRIAMDATGHTHYSEQRVDNEAAREGIYNSLAGTTGGVPGWEGLFRHYGVPASFGAHSYATVAADLAKGDAVIAVVNAQTLWGPQGWVAADPSTTDPDHALIVEAVGPTAVTLVDTGIPTGDGEVVPRSTFTQAWATSGYLTVVVS